MRDDHKLALKKVRQQILAFCLRHNCSFPGNNHWTQAHLKWLREIKLGDVYQEILGSLPEEKVPLNESRKTQPPLQNRKKCRIFSCAGRPLKVFWERRESAVLKKE